MVNGERRADAECTRASLLGRYEIGRTLGEGNFGKVKYARHIASGGHFAIKILDRSKILSLRIDDQVGHATHVFRRRALAVSDSSPVRSAEHADGGFFVHFALRWRCLQIRREIGTLKLLKHPNVVRLHEVRGTPNLLQTSPFVSFLHFFLDWILLLLAPSSSSWTNSPCLLDW
jgi:5'-AMP-activated protein kinase, catalytic alpha subunit